MNELSENDKGQSYLVVKGKYRTPKGKDERETPYPSTFTEEEVNELKRRGIKFINWHGFAIAEGPGFDAGFFDDVSQLRKERRSIIILVTGKAGEGKTWAGLTFCEMFDPKFDIDKQVCFTIEHILKIFNNAEGYVVKRGQCILIDESQFVAGARNWYDQLQKELMQNMAAIRSRGYIIIIIALHRSQLDKVIRKHLLTYQIHLEDRGAMVEYTIHLPRFEEKERQSRQGQIILPVPWDNHCPNPDCLVCYAKDWCLNKRAIYERNKDMFLESRASIAVKKAEDKAMERDALSTNEYVEMIVDVADADRKNIEWTNQGNVDVYWIEDEMERRGHKISHRMAIRVAKAIGRHHPELKEEETDPGR